VNRWKYSGYRTWDLVICYLPDVILQFSLYTSLSEFIPCM